MIVGENMGAGMYYFPAMNPDHQAKKRHQEWSIKFDEVITAKKQHGWESKECQLALIEMKQWQEGAS
jgi:hypothetical protein